MGVEADEDVTSSRLEPAIESCGVNRSGFGTTTAPAASASWAVLSDDIPSTTRTSRPPSTSWARIDVTHAVIVAASLRAGTMTETLGSTGGRIRRSLLPWGCRPAAQRGH